MGAMKSWVKGTVTHASGNCAGCGHGNKAAAGCHCPSSWCPCHRAYFGHGGHGCDNRHNGGGAR